jgi:hypothetical protein
VIALSKPTLSLALVLGSLATGDRVDNLRANAAALIAGEALYDQLGDTAQLFAYPRPTPSSVGADSKWSYEQRLANKKGAARTLYAEMREASPWNKCPLCHHRPVGTLDHYLPQKIYPTLALVPLNLIPTCRDCNWVKQQFVAASEAEQPLHPYYDDFAADDWLQADLVEGPGAPLVFRAVPLAGWTGVQADRVKKHFGDLGLNDLYAANAGAEVQAIRARLRELLAVAGSDAVSEHLRSEADSRASDITDPWRSVAYSAWGSSDWFCAGGFDID